MCALCRLPLLCVLEHIPRSRERCKTGETMNRWGKFSGLLFIGFAYLIRCLYRNKKKPPSILVPRGKLNCFSKCRLSFVVGLQLCYMSTKCMTKEYFYSIWSGSKGLIMLTIRLKNHTGYLIKPLNFEISL